MILICGTVEAGKGEIIERQCCVTKVYIFFLLSAVRIRTISDVESNFLLYI